MSIVKVCEHFYSVQGEGPGVGIPSYLIRFSRCPLFCPNCDSKFAWKDEGEDLRDVIENLNIPEQCNNVIITGGEPSLHFNEESFHKLLKKIGKRYIDIETTALHCVASIKESNICDNIRQFNAEITPYISDNYSPRYIVSPKLNLDCYQNESVRLMDIFNFYRLINPQYNKIVYKIVYDKWTRPTIEKFIEVCIPYWFRENVYIMPYTPIHENVPLHFMLEYQKSCQETIEFCKKHGLKYTPRVHINVYGLKKGV